ncbi:MAG: PaaI family thioesterase [Proteobacteria bacterium]|nr:PaaI family thioesterase [Pseudomonadota bacterium]MBI3496491.1 PaaI family thioesterase [Pseudomonadota bacterium]
MNDVSDQTRRRTIEWQDPQAGLAAASGLDGLGFLRAIVAGAVAPPPMARLLGLELESAEPGVAVFAVEPGEHHYNPMATVHGGLLATLCDSAMGCAILSTLPPATFFTTLELSVNYVRAATAETGRLTCEGRVLHRGGRIATAESKVLDEAGKLFAHATTTCMILEAKS